MSGIPSKTRALSTLESSRARERGALGKGRGCLVVIHAPSPTRLGERVDLEEGGHLYIGRGAVAAIDLGSDAVSREHAEITLEGGECRVRDLGSTNGTFVNGERIERQTLRPGDVLEVGGVGLKYLAGDDLDLQLHEALRRLALEDALTRAWNRRYFMEAFQREHRRAIRGGRPLSLILFDIDKFKAVNDTYGHAAGDSVLVGVAERARSIVRDADVFARYGGEEFVVLLPETAREGACVVAEKVREAIRAGLFEHEGASFRVTSSFGVAELAEGEEPQALTERADALLYRAKRAGRDRVES